MHFNILSHFLESHFMAAKYHLKQYVNKFRSTRVKSPQYSTATNGGNIVISVHKITLRIVIDCFPL